MGRKLFLLVSLLALLVGCQSPPELAEDDLPRMTAAANTRITPMIVKAATPNTAGPLQTLTYPKSPQAPTEPAKPVKHLLNWQFVGTIPRNSQSGVMYDGKYMIWVEEVIPPGSKSAERTFLNLQLGQNRYNALRTTDGRKVSLSPGYAVLNGGYLAVQEAARSGDTELVWLFNLNTGEKKTIPQREGRFSSTEQHLPSKMEVIAGRLLWNALGEGKKSCIRVFEWNMADPHDLLCAEMPTDLLEPFRSNNNQITYGMINMQDQGGALYQRPLTLEHGLVELETKPSPWVKIIFYQPTGLEYMTSDGQLTVWIGASAETAGTRKMWAVGPDGIPQMLGDPTKNIAICGGQVFWPGSGGLHAWKPGGRIEIVFQGEGKLTPTCSDGWLTFASSPVDASDIPVYTYNLTGYVPATGATPYPLPFSTFTPASGKTDRQVTPSSTPLSPMPSKNTPSRTPLPPTSTKIAPSRTPLPPTPTKVTSVPTEIPPSLTPVTPTLTEVPPSRTPVPPTATRRPTRTPRPPTPTRIPPSQTPVPPEPTQVPPEPTEVPPVPTEVPPEPTQVPPEPTVVPPVPTEVPPAPTEVPPVPTELPPDPTQPPPLE